MPTHVPGEHAAATPARSTSPLISVFSGQILITGNKLLPNRAVTVRITYEGHDVVDYLAFISDADGCLSAALPDAAITSTRHITVTDHRHDPTGDGGLLWSNTVIVAAK